MKRISPVPESNDRPADDANLAEVLFELERLSESNVLDESLDGEVGPSNDAPITSEPLDDLTDRLDALSVGDLERLMHARGCIAMLGELHRHETVRNETESDVTLETETVPATIGRYKVQRLLGRGGFANVYLALDETLDRQVALKVPHSSVLANANAAARFQREAKAIAILDHPLIVPVYEAGQVDDQAYLSLAYCPGEDLQSFLTSSQTPIPFRTVALAMRSIATAIGYAHSKGFVHRDIKPGNVLIADDDAARSCPWHERLRVTDFGLAKAITGDLDRHQQSNTIEGLAVGTPAYMSPEQCRGDKNISPASDVFALGSMMQELLIGAPPHRRESYAKTFRSIETEEAPRLRSTRTDTPKDLQAIVTKCLEKKPSGRYQTAFELSEDLDRWLNDRPIEARTIGSIERLSRWTRRNPLVSTALTIGVLGLSIGTMIAALKYNEANVARQSAEAAAQQASVSAATSDEVLQTLLSSFADVNPMVGGDINVNASDVLRKAHVKISGGLSQSPATKHRALVALSQACSGVGDARTAVKCLTQADQICVSEFSNDQTRRYRTLNALAAAQQQAGHLLDALLTRETILAITRSAIGNGDRTNDLAGTGQISSEQIRDELAQTHLHLGRLDRAKDLLLTGLFDDDGSTVQETRASDGTVTSSVGDQTISDLVVIDPLTKAYLDAGLIEKAIAVAQKECELSAETFGNDHLSTLMRRQSLAFAIAASGDSRLGFRQLQDVVRDLKSVLGEDHPQTITSQITLAGMTATRQRAGYGLDALDKTRRLAIQRFGDSHPLLIQIDNLRGTLSRISGDVDIAIEIYEDTLRRATESLGLSHPDTAAVLVNLCGIYARTERSDEAVGQADRCLAELVSKVGPKNRVYQDLQGKLIENLLLQGDFDRANRISNELLSTRRSQFGDYHARTRQAISSVVASLMRMGNFAQAESEAIDWLNNLRHDPVANDRTINEALLDLAVCLVEQKKDAEAADRMDELVPSDEGSRHLAALEMAVQGAIASRSQQPEFADRLLTTAFSRLRSNAALLSPHLRYHMTLIANRIADHFDATGNTPQAIRWKLRVDKLRRQMSLPLQ